MFWIYIWDQRRGRPKHLQVVPRWAVAGTGVNGSLCRNRRRLYLKTAGESEVPRDMRGSAER